MSPRRSRSELVARRGDLMAELFLQEMNPQFLSRPTSEDVGYDLLAGFQNDKGGINTFAIKVKSTEQVPSGRRFSLPRRTFQFLAGSNIPGLLLVADVKENRMYYAWLASDNAAGSAAVSVPLTKVDDATRTALQRQFAAATARVAAAG